MFVYLIGFFCGICEHRHYKTRRCVRPAKTQWRLRSVRSRSSLGRVAKGLSKRYADREHSDQTGRTIKPSRIWFAVSAPDHCWFIYFTFIKLQIISSIMLNYGLMIALKLFNLKFMHPLSYCKCMDTKWWNCFCFLHYKHTWTAFGNGT